MNTQTQEFVVTARKWRPLLFSDVVGQGHITITLKNAISSNRIHHAYLFSGPRGVGKTTTARILARALNCESPVDSEPCNKCASCQSVLQGKSLDVIEIDGASNNSVEDIRKLRENSKYPPSSGKYKLYIIDEVHMLSTSAFNALLKTLEEPPPHLMFVFATTEQHKVPATILSRCQRFEFRRMELADIASQIKFIADRESIEIDEESLLIIAKKADGSMRDAQSIFDQVNAFCGNKIHYTDMADALHLVDQDFFFKITTAIKERDLSSMFNIAKDVITKGYDLHECLSGLLEHLRNILTIKVCGNTNLIETSSYFLEKYTADANYFNQQDLLRYMNLVSSTEQSIKYSTQPRVKFELALVQLASMDTTIEISTLIKELKEIKSGKGFNIAGSSIKQSNPAEKQYVPLSPAKPVSFQPKTEDRPIIQKPEISTISEEKPVYQSSAKVTNLPSQRKGNIDADTLREGWEDFVNNFANGGTGLHLLKQQEMIFPIFLNGEIIIQANSDFTADAIASKKTMLLDLLNKYYGSLISVKITTTNIPIISQNADYEPEEHIEITQSTSKNVTKPLSKNKQKVINTSKSKIIDEADLENKHPVEISIIECFNPKLLE